MNNMWEYMYCLTIIVQNIMIMLTSAITMSIKPVCRLVSFSLDSNALYMAQDL